MAQARCCASCVSTPGAGSSLTRPGTPTGASRCGGALSFFLSLHPKLNRGRLRFARARRYIPAMDDRAYWTRKLQEAEAELDAATTRTAINAAAKRLQRVKAELKRLEQKAPTRRGSGVARTAASS
jgi:hypothetical protein